MLSNCYKLPNGSVNDNVFLELKVNALLQFCKKRYSHANEDSVFVLFESGYK